MKALLPACLAALLCACSVLPRPADTGGADWQFAAIGDTPYTERERQQLPGLLGALSATQSAFIMHVGDLKSGGESCDDALLESRVLSFLRPGLPPFAFTPGDNDWSDCHRASNGGFDPAERLSFLRQRFFAADAPIRLSLTGTQNQAQAMPAFAEHAENLLWRRGPVVFVSLNVPGPDNNRGAASFPSAEFLQRGEANRAWLAEAFDQARADSDVRALVVFFQADPDFAVFQAGHPRPGFAPLLQQLQFIAASFPGEVLLIHGDTHRALIDHPMPIPGSARRTLPNFTRAIVPGSPYMGWIEVFVRENGSPVLSTGLHAYQAETPTP